MARQWKTAASIGLSSLLVAATLLAVRFASAGRASAASSSHMVRANGGALVDETSGAPITLQGVNRAGGSYACAQGWGYTDGPNDQAMADAMLKWNVQIVRLDFNSGCWLGTVGGGYSGANYRTFMKNYVQEFLNDGYNVIIDLQGIDPAKAGGNMYPVMPDDSATTFWSQIAQTFGDNHRLILNLYNEPHDMNWGTWKNGGTVSDSGVSFHTPGMQAMLNAARGAGFHGLALLDGEQWANDFSGFMSNLPSDPDHNIAAGWHPYEGNNIGTNFDSWVGSVKGKAPIIASEFGIGSQSWGNALFDYFATNQISHAAWNWGADGSGMKLIADYYSAQPAATTHAQVIYSHYTANAPTPTVSATPSTTPPPTSSPSPVQSPTPSPAQRFVTENGVSLPNPAYVNQQNAIAYRFTMAASGKVIVQYMFLDAKSLKVVQTVNRTVTVTGGRMTTDSFGWYASSAGRRIVRIGVFSTDWSKLYHWNNNAGAITVSSAP